MYEGKGVIFEKEKTETTTRTISFTCICSCHHTKMATTTTSSNTNSTSRKRPRPTPALRPTLTGLFRFRRRSVESFLLLLFIVSVWFLTYLHSIVVVVDNDEDRYTASADVDSSSSTKQRSSVIRRKTVKVGVSARVLEQKRTTQQQQQQRRRSAVMVLATVPLDKRHVAALWSELQCFVMDQDQSSSSSSSSVDNPIEHVVLSAPVWSQPVMERLLVEIRNKIPHFQLSRRQDGSTAAPKVTIEARYFENDRYDTGLWCDALQSIEDGGDRNNEDNNEQKGKEGFPYDDVVLLNDSLFALRDYTGVLDTLQSEPHLRMTSLNYVTSDPKGIWLESVFRSFDRQGLEVFRDHSCVSPEDPMFCPGITDARDLKRCITEHHEIEIARLFMPTQVEGMFPSDVPKELWKESRPYATWVLHVDYWRETLVGQLNFPAAKVTKRNMIKSLNNPLLDHCTRTLDRSFLDSLDYNLGKRTIQK